MDVATCYQEHIRAERPLYAPAASLKLLLQSAQNGGPVLTTANHPVTLQHDSFYLKICNAVSVAEPRVMLHTSYIHEYSN